MAARNMDIGIRIKPELDSQFRPAALWNRAFRSRIAASVGAVDVAIALERPDKTCSVFKTHILPDKSSNKALNLRYLERIFKFLNLEIPPKACLLWSHSCQPLKQAVEVLERARAYHL